jgi:hypothetical protein
VVYPPDHVSLSPTVGGDVIEIDGQHFGNKASDLRVSVGPRQCKALKITVPNERLACTVPEVLPCHEWNHFEVDLKLLVCRVLV